MLPYRFFLAGLFTLALFVTSCTSSTNIQDNQSGSVPKGPLAIVNGQPIDAEEFTHQFSRTVSNVDEVRFDSLEALEDFLVRYVDFKVKVLEARDAKYQLLPEIVDEIGQYKTQLARPFLLERKVFEPLVRQMYDRRSQAVDASHILITVAEDASPSDTLAAYGQISSLRDSVLAGVDFSSLAARYSMDPSAKGAPGSPGAGGNLGFFGGGRMVDSFENQAFKTPVGGVSEIFRSQFGYHILKVNDRMAMPDDRILAHIMVRPRGQTAADVADADQRLSKVTSRLAAGEDFAVVANDLSDDRQSATNGGHLGLISFDAGLPFSFRDAGFGLTEEGEYVGPVQTPFGSHFIKLIEIQPLKSFEEEYENLKSQVNRLPRAAAAEKAFAEELRDQMGYWIDSTRIGLWSSAMSQDSLFRMLASKSFSPADSAHVLMSLDNQQYTSYQFAEYVASNKLPQGEQSQSRLFSIAESFLNAEAINHEIDLLETREPEFAQTMQDFRDGLILFRLMEDSVWTAAASDSTGLRAFFDLNKANYTFPDRIRVISFSAVADSLVNGVVQKYKAESGKQAISWAKGVANMAIRIDTTYVEEPSGSIYDQVFELEEGEITPSTAYNRGFIALAHAGVDPAHPMTYDDARAVVLNAYQADIEARLLKKLHEKYQVQLFPERLGNLMESSHTAEKE